MTVHGFIDDKPSALEKYKKQYSHQWLQVLGSADFDIVEEQDIDAKDIFDTSENE
jgi:hypothetical protein